MDYAGLSKLNIKTLRGYLLSYNISTQGMIEKQDLIRAIQSMKPIPESSEVYFREHLPATPEKSSSLLDEIANFGRSGSSSDASGGAKSPQGSSTSSSDGWSWDLDKFFSRLFGGDDAPPNAGNNSQSSRSHSQQQQQQRGPSSARPSQYHPQAGTSFRPFTPNLQPQPQPNHNYRPPPGHPPPLNTHPSASSSYSSQRPSHTYTPPRSGAGTPQTPRPAQYANATSTSGPRTTSTNQTSPQANGTRHTTTRTTTSSYATSSTTTTVSLNEVMASNTDPSTMSIKAIKSILDSSFVTYVGVVEKKDLVERLQKLIDNTRAEQAMVQEQEAAEAKKAPGSPAATKSPSTALVDDDNLCKICCDAALNCVMLNCNHMSTCMDW
ncbi:hypothetical protein BGZ94_005337 [Podila epigama]|nr:hypothetical protein BGZ94_005337 [Podila epigama]